MLIRTKIIATLGPASSDLETIGEMAEAGCDMFRVNFSHGHQQQRSELLANIRKVSQETGEPLGILADLCGPKIRVGEIDGGSVLLAQGQSVALQREEVLGQTDRISTTLGELVSEVRKGESLLLDDGKIKLNVAERLSDEEIICEVIRGGILASGKGVNLPHTDLTLSAITEKDRRDIEWIAKNDFDYVALSFVRSADDVNELRELLNEAGCDAHIVAKIEKPQALDNIESLVETADAIMVARGDLGVEMNLPAVPVAQKKVARLCQKAGKPCIIATQMLESMTSFPSPTRAEVSDVANAVLDHTDAVMLSGETAVGKFPVSSVRMMNEIVAEIQAYDDQTATPTKVQYAPDPTVAALASSVREIIAAEKISAVAVLTETGTTARMFAKNRLPLPILAISPNQQIVRRMCLYYGVQSLRAEIPEHTRGVLDIAARFACEKKIACKGDKMIVVSGRPLGKPGSTNTLVVHQIA